MLHSPAYSIVDLTAAYGVPVGYPGDSATRVERGFAFTADYGALVVVDEFEYPSQPNVTWGMHVNATATSKGDEAIITNEGVKLYLRAVEPKGARWVDKWAGGGFTAFFATSLLFPSCPSAAFLRDGDVCPRVSPGHPRHPFFVCDWTLFCPSPSPSA